MPVEVPKYSELHSGARGPEAASCLDDTVTTSHPETVRCAPEATVGGPLMLCRLSSSCSTQLRLTFKPPGTWKPDVEANETPDLNEANTNVMLHSACVHHLLLGVRIRG